MCLVVAVALAALGAEPQCPTDWQSCIASHMPQWKHGWADESRKDLLCNTTAYMIYDYCFTKCPMRLIITDPPELRTWMCAMDNAFKPYAPNAHIDLFHPLNNVEMELEAVGNPSVGETRLGCSASDYGVGNKTFSNKIALARRGTCGYDAKARNANGANAAMLFVVDYWPYYNWRTMEGSSAGIESFPALFAARHEADYILAAMDRGVKVKGKFQYQCSDMPEGFLDNPEEYPWDYCPDSELAYHDTCKVLDSSEQQPLCEVCSLELQLPGAEQLCLFGNNLRPRKRETLMHLALPMPHAAKEGEVVYATELPNRGCSVSDYAGLAGKIVFVPETGRCPLIQTVRNAQEAEVKAYVLVTSTFLWQWYRVRAYSHHVDIPVHTVDYHATPKLLAFVAAGNGVHMPGVGYALSAMNFSRGEMPQTVPKVSDPPANASGEAGIVVDTSPDFEMSGGTLACLAVMGVDLVMLVVLFVLQHREAVRLPAEVRDRSFSIPLKVASMGLSLTLLMVIAVVSFSLATMAGKESTDQAIENGRAAVYLAYDSSEKSTIQLSDTIRNNVIDRVLAALQKEIHTMEHGLKVVEDLFFGFNGTWAEFDARVVMLWRMMRNADTTYEDVLFQVYTTRGFFANHDRKTDDRPDDLRKDGVVGSVAQTNEGWRYGVNYWSENFVTREFTYQDHTPAYQYNASRMLAGHIGDPLAVTAGKPATHTTWIPGKLVVPLAFHPYHPMAAYRPLYGGEGQYHGTLEVHNGLAMFIDSALDTRMLSGGALQNMSVLVIDNTDKAILGSHNIGTQESRLEGFVHLDKLLPMRGLYYMHKHPSVVVTALTNYLDSVDGWSQHTGEFDQKVFFTEQPHVTSVRIEGVNGEAVDTSPHAWDVEMRDATCGLCVVYDMQSESEAMMFDGSGTLHIYRNMTRRTPIVSESRISPPREPCRSKYATFNEVLRLSDGTQCVSRTWNPNRTHSVQRCLLRPDIAEFREFMVSMRIRPDVRYTETSPRATTPRLFTDTLVGDANIRLFANGQLYLFVLRYGCRTRPYDGGFPVGVWTTITASVGGGYCRVYVNGTLYSEVIDARHIQKTQAYTDPYRVGQYFRGRIQSVQLFSDRMTHKEVESLHTERKLVRDVQPHRQFVQMKTLDMAASHREGVKWGVAVVLSRADIMRVVDANRLETLADVQIQEDNTLKSLRQKANATIMVIAAIGMTSVVLFLVFNNMLTRPFERTAAAMADAAVLHVDFIPDAMPSPITELRAMNTAMRLMLENLQQYKSFMPQSVQLDDCPSDDVPTATPDELQGGSQSNRTVSGRSSRTTSSGGTLSIGVSVNRRQLRCSLSTRRFTYLVLNVRRWHEKVASTAEEQNMLGLHSTLLDVVLLNFAAHKGVSEVFSGDRFACSFNAAKNAPQHTLLACSCGQQCRNDMQKLGLAISASVVSGEGRVGNIGNAAMRRFSFLTPIITWGYALERFCRSRDASIMVDQAVCRDVELTLSLRLLDAISFEKLTNKVIRVYEVMGARSTGDAGEWMYMIQHGEDTDPMRRWNECASRIVCGDFEDDGSLLSVVLAQGDDKATARLVDAFHHHHFEPCRIYYH